MQGKIQVQNLKCMGCAGTIKKKLSSFDYLKNIEVDVSTSTLSFDYTEKEQLDAIDQALFKLGYPNVNDENSTTSKVKSYVSCALGKINS